MQRFAVIATLSVSLLLTGAVEAWERALVAWGWALALALLPRGRPDAGVLDWVRGVGWALLGCVPSLLVVPTALRLRVAPGLEPFLGDAGWGTLGVAPDATLVAMADAATVGVAGVAILGAVRGARREVVAQGVALAAAFVVALVYLHAALRWTAWFGVVPVRAVDRVFLPPLINPNHTGALLVAAAPFVLQARARSVGWRRHGATGTLLGILCVPLVARSMGVALALAALGATLLLLPERPARRWLWAALVVAGGAAMATAVHALTPRWWALSVAPRLEQWTDTLALWRAFPWFGVGLGAYGEAYPPWRTVPGFLTFAHAHSDGLEWVAETGAWGLVCGVFAVRTLRRRRVAPAATGGLAGLAALLSLAVVDFPLHIPAVAFCAVALGVLAFARRDPPEPLCVPASWRLVAAIVASTLTLEAVREHALAAAVEEPEGTAANNVLRLSPWGEDAARIWLARAEAADGEVRHDALRRASTLAPASAKVARGVATLALKEAPSPAEAGAWLDHAVGLDPQDLRLWWLVARGRAQEGLTPQAAEAAADAFRRWPHEVPTSPAIWAEAWSWLPVGVWWLDALEDAPAHWSARLGWWSLREGDPETALLAMEQAASLRPDVFAHNTTRIDALLALGRNAEARAAAEAWTRDAPTHAWAWVALASVALSSGDDPLGGAVTIAAWRTAGQPVARRLIFGCIQACEAGRCACDLAAARQLLDAERAQDRGDAVRCAASRDAVRTANPWLRAHGSGIACGGGD